MKIVIRPTSGLQLVMYLVQVSIECGAFKPMSRYDFNTYVEEFNAYNGIDLHNPDEIYKEYVFLFKRYLS